MAELDEEVEEQDDEEEEQEEEEEEEATSRPELWRESRGGFTFAAHCC